MTKSERRRHPRVSWHTPATFSSDPQGLFHQGRCIESEQLGSLIRGPIPLEAGSGLELRIDMGEFCLAPVDHNLDTSDSPSPAQEREV